MLYKFEFGVIPHHRHHLVEVIVVLAKCQSVSKFELVQFSNEVPEMVKIESFYSSFMENLNAFWEVQPIPNYTVGIATLCKKFAG